MADLKTRLATAQLGNGEGNKALEAILSATSAKPTDRQVVDLPLSMIVPWRDRSNSKQPFRPYSQSKMESLMESMRQFGLLHPIVVRPLGDGTYQILSGHNRAEAARRLGWPTIPAVVLHGLSDSDAANIMVDLNFNQRDHILPSERAWGWKIKMDNLRHQGTSSHDGTKWRSDEALAQEEGVGRNTIQRYIRLTRLAPPLLDIVDGYQYDENGGWCLCDDKPPIIPLNAAEALASLSTQSHERLADIIQVYSVARLTKAQADRLAAVGADLTPSQIKEILCLEKAPALKPAEKPTAPVVLKLQITADVFRLDGDPGGPSQAELKKYLAEEALNERLIREVRCYIQEKRGATHVYL